MKINKTASAKITYKDFVQRVFLEPKESQRLKSVLMKHVVKMMLPPSQVMAAAKGMFAANGYSALRISRPSLPTILKWIGDGIERDTGVISYTPHHVTALTAAILDSFGVTYEDVLYARPLTKREKDAVKTHLDHLCDVSDVEADDTVFCYVHTYNEQTVVEALRKEFPQYADLLSQTYLFRAESPVGLVPIPTKLLLSC